MVLGLKADLETNVDDIIKTRWDKRDGLLVPESEDVKFIHEAVALDATFLYADLADSTELAKKDKYLASEVFQSFLSCASRVILHEDGAIRSFDGDRVMAVFIGTDKNSRATRCALKIHWVFEKIVKAKLTAAYGTKLGGFNLNYGCGLDTGTIWAVRGGVRNNSDLVWVGRAPNLAAKLSSFRSGNYRTRITQAVYDKLNKESKFSKGVDMWERQTWENQGGLAYFRSSYSWTVQ